MRNSEVPNCEIDVYLLLGYILSKSRTQLLAASRDKVDSLSEQQFRQLLERRVRREPVAYIIGEQEFWSLNFHVSQDVLIPRPETEFLIEKTLDHVKNIGLPDGLIVDLCCGSGAISVVLAKELTREILAIDISESAARVTRRNCIRHGVDKQVRITIADLFSHLLLDGEVALVVSNPPYVSSSALHGEIEPEVAVYEPAIALNGGEDGLDIIRRIRYELPRILKPGGVLFMEIGYDQGPAVKELFETTSSGQSHFSHVSVLQDYAGKDRVLSAIKN